MGLINVDNAMYKMKLQHLHTVYFRTSRSIIASIINTNFINTKTYNICILPSHTTTHSQKLHGRLFWYTDIVKIIDFTFYVSVPTQMGRCYTLLLDFLVSGRNKPYAPANCRTLHDHSMGWRLSMPKSLKSKL